MPTKTLRQLLFVSLLKPKIWRWNKFTTGTRQASTGGACRSKHWLLSEKPVHRGSNPAKKGSPFCVVLMPVELIGLIFLWWANQKNLNVLEIHNQKTFPQITTIKHRRGWIVTYFRDGFSINLYLKFEEDYTNKTCRKQLFCFWTTPHHIQLKTSWRLKMARYLFNLFNISCLANRPRPDRGIKKIYRDNLLKM